MRERHVPTAVEDKAAAVCSELSRHLYRAARPARTALDVGVPERAAYAAWASNPGPCGTRLSRALLELCAP